VNNLLALTSDSIFKIEADRPAISRATDFVVRRQNGRGSSRLSPAGRRQRVLLPDQRRQWGADAGLPVLRLTRIDSNDVTIFSPHLFPDFNIVSWAYAQEPRSLIWAARSDGKLLCFTWEQEQQVWGWTLCETDGLVESVCVISEGAEDRLYLTVRRGTKLLIERMAAASWSGVENSCFLDSAVTYAFDTSDTLRNLQHLEGLTISALADGEVVSNLVVSNGMVTLPYEASIVTAGLPYTATIETLPLAYQGRGGWTIARPQTQSKVIVRLVESRGIQAGPNDDELVDIDGRTTEILGQPNSLITGLREAFLRHEINDGARVVVQSDQPLPMTVSAIYLDVSVAP
jgi:hypothetical protein